MTLILWRTCYNELNFQDPSPPPPVRYNFKRVDCEEVFLIYTSYDRNLDLLFSFSALETGGAAGEGGENLQETPAPPHPPPLRFWLGGEKVGSYILVTLPPVSTPLKLLLFKSTGYSNNIQGNYEYKTLQYKNYKILATITPKCLQNIVGGLEKNHTWYVWNYRSWWQIIKSLIS